MHLAFRRKTPDRIRWICFCARFLSWFKLKGRVFVAASALGSVCVWRCFTVDPRLTQKHVLKAVTTQVGMNREGLSPVFRFGNVPALVKDGARGCCTWWLWGFVRKNLPNARLGY